MTTLSALDDQVSPDISGLRSGVSDGVVVAASGVGSTSDRAVVSSGPGGRPADTPGSLQLSWSEISTSVAALIAW